MVLGSRKPFAVFHSSLNPLPALTTNIWFNVCKKRPNSEVKNDCIAKLLTAIYFNSKGYKEWYDLSIITVLIGSRLEMDIVGSISTIAVSIPNSGSILKFMCLSSCTSMHPYEHMHVNVEENRQAINDRGR